MIQIWNVKAISSRKYLLTFRRIVLPWKRW